MQLVANQNLQRTDLYLSVVYRPFVNKAQKAVQKAGKRTIAEIKQDRLAAIEKMNELDTSGIVPMTHVFDVKNVLRDDVVTNGDGSADALKNAPAQKEGQYMVPITI